MKHLWLILFVLPLFAQDIVENIYFKNGVKLKGELISIRLNKELNPETGFTSEVVFQPTYPKWVPLILSGGTLDDGKKFIFDVKDIDKIVSKTDEHEISRIVKVLYSNKVQNEYSNRDEIELIILDALVILNYHIHNINYYDREAIIFYQRGLPGSPLEGKVLGELKLNGKLISIKHNQELNAETGFTSEVVFKPDDKKQVPLLLAGGTKNNGEHYIFDVKDIKRIYFFTHRDYVWASDDVFRRTPGPYGHYISLYEADGVQLNYLNRQEIDVRINSEIKRQAEIGESRQKALRIAYCLIPLFALLSYSLSTY